MKADLIKKTVSEFFKNLYYNFLLVYKILSKYYLVPKNLIDHIFKGRWLIEF